MISKTKIKIRCLFSALQIILLKTGQGLQSTCIYSKLIFTLYSNLGILYTTNLNIPTSMEKYLSLDAILNCYQYYF